jgi:hypothetical protein
MKVLRFLLGHTNSTLTYPPQRATQWGLLLNAARSLPEGEPSGPLVAAGRSRVVRV